VTTTTTSTEHRACDLVCVAGESVPVTTTTSTEHRACDLVCVAGESVPVTKTPIAEHHAADTDIVTTFHVKEHSRHVLFCGTHVIQTRYYDNKPVKAVVIRTGQCGSSQ